MATGSPPEECAGKALDVQGDGESVGVPAEGELEGSSFNPLGNPGMEHWQASYIDHAGLEDRGNIFFAAVEMTRMPMVVTDPRQSDNPIVFANRAFLDLTLYPEEEVIGRNCHFLQGPDTNSSEQSLLQAQEMEAIGQLTAGMAHDFNNLLQVINGNMELALLSLDASHRAAEPIRRAQRAAMKAGKLTGQLLTFARKQRLEPRRVNLNALLVRMIFPIDGVRGEFSTDRAHAVDEPAAPNGSAEPRILVVEDNQDVRELAESLVGAAGYAVVSAPSGEQALALFKDGDGIDLVFTDVVTPDGMNGLQLADQVRQRRPDTPILITTGYTDELPPAPQARRLDILGKPYRQEELLSRVRAILPPSR